MGKSPEELKQEIEQTRRQLSGDVDSLEDKISPSRVVQRRVVRARGAAGHIRDRVMGPRANSGPSVGDRATSAAASMKESAVSAPGVVRRQSQGNPLAAGLLAFAGGWLVSSVLPASHAEEQTAVAVKDQASQLAGPAKEQARQAAQEVRDNLQEPLQQAVQQVKEHATDAASTVRDEGSATAGEVAGEAKDGAQTIRETGS
jgi:cell division septum initiation protein DivIVA